MMRIRVRKVRSAGRSLWPTKNSWAALSAFPDRVASGELTLFKREKASKTQECGLLRTAQDQG